MSKTFRYEYGFSSGNVVEVVGNNEIVTDYGERVELNGVCVLIVHNYDYKKVTPILPAEDWSKESLKELVYGGNG